MKTLVLILSLLAAAKLGVQWYIFRHETAALIVETYRPVAIAACSEAARRSSARADAEGWSNPTDVRFEIGRSGGGDVFSLDGSAFDQRFRRPYLVVTTSARTARVFCEYDLAGRTATVHRL